MEIARYIQLPQFISLITKGLFIPKTSLFEDELEGLASVMFNSDGEGIAPKMENDWAKEWIYTSCWYKSTGESMAMWNLYGSNAESLMIKTTTTKLQNLIENTKKYKSYPCRLNFVSYFSFSEYPKPLYERGCARKPSSECSHLFDYKLDDFFYKHPAYRHEQEIRLCVVDKTAVEPYERNRNFGITLPVGAEFIDEIVFAPNATPWFKDVVHEIMSKYGIEAYIADSELDWHKELFSPRSLLF
ncbi:DUF2971 domain-containing protein [Vibrio vulnificus]|uniref:DUF2971 domain-containing protein n=1 Tax=Vibrio vulnificus TaxID=672 RepID=UPI001A30E39B|nr:DUF2971 domain-containing protein [Vibrio vulnificus]EKO3855365.1 DUF2971 domain-containing protein [Vibrio harveyi]EHH2489082.1 DUF2971 domain-containing protein [Vibrio vulnificus]EHI9279424.1 DUF2971 domain-containing protein [Vibrio vulnificus]EHI9302670.1 DUF2971 domain-containing protein [Vibrio vulnificus]